jgi:hypothetical protein
MRLGLFEKPLITYLTMAASIAIGVLVALMFLRVDNLINVDLYKYNLQFDPVWYNSYSFWSKLLLGSLGVLIALNLTILSLGLIRDRRASFAKGPIEAILETNLHEVKTTNAVKPPINTSIAEGEQHCANCNTSFVQPASKLDFIQGKPVVINACPNCGEPLTINSSKNGKTLKKNTKQAPVRKRQAKRKRRSKESI